MSDDKFNMKWNDVIDGVEEIARYITEQKLIKSDTCLVPIVRGGLPIATALSHRLSSPGHIVEIVPVTIQTRDNEIIKTKELEEVFIWHNDIIIIDDILDTGKTARYIADTFKRLRDEKGLKTKVSFFSLCRSKEVSLVGFGEAFEHWMSVYMTNCWVVFPWEISSIYDDPKTQRQKRLEKMRIHDSETLRNWFAN